MNGWVRLWRKMKAHAVWLLPPAQFKVWITILVLANHRDTDWWDGLERVAIPGGSFIRSQPHLAQDAGVGREVVRDALRNLERIGSIRTKTKTKRWTLVEVVNWATYQGAETDENQEKNLPGTKGEPRGNHSGRMKEGENERKDLSPASGLTLAQYLEKFSPEGQEVLRQTIPAITSTRKSGKVAESVLDSLARKLSRYPASVVLQACRIYLDRDFVSQGKDERYLLGIIRGEAKRQNGDGREPSSPFVSQEGEAPTPPTFRSPPLPQDAGSACH